MKRHFITILMAAIALNTSFAQETVLWGGPGSKDGEFDGGLNGWTTVGIKSGDDTKKALALFSWDANAQALGGYTAAANATLNSASKNNGAAVFNSDVLDSGTGGGKTPSGGGSFGAGVCPIPHESELISPLIDVKNNKDITLVFSQLFCNFQSGRDRSGSVTASTAVMYSRDGGTTWSDPVAIYPNEQCKTYQFSSSYSPTVITRVQLPGAGGTDKLRVKFSFAGDYYFWIVDDVAIVPMENNNVRANLNFFAPAENLFAPITQTRETYFLNDIANLGAKKQPNVRHTMSIYKTNASGQLIQPAVFRDTLKFGTVDVDTTIENIPFPNGFAPTGVKSNYAGIYELLSDSTDIEPWNNRTSFVFGVSDSTFAKDNGRTRSVAPALQAGAAATFGYGNVYYIKNGKNFKSGTMTFGLENGPDHKDENIDVYLYEWSGDTNTNNEIDEDELLTVGYSTYKIKGTEVFSNTASQNRSVIRITLDNFETSGKPIQLKDNTFYAVYVEHTAKSVDDPMFLSAYDRYNYAATDLAFSGLDKQSFHSIIKIGDGKIRTGGFSAMVPTIRWNIRTIIDAKEPLLAPNTVSVSPNPANEFINVKFNFESMMNDVEIKVTDMNGREVLNANFNNIQNDNYNLDIASLQAGVYNLFIRTEKGVNTKTFVVQK